MGFSHGNGREKNLFLKKKQRNCRKQLKFARKRRERVRNTDINVPHCCLHFGTAAVVVFSNTQDRGCWRHPAFQGHPKRTPAWGCLGGFPNGNSSGHAGLERIGGLDALVLRHPLGSWESKGRREIWPCLAAESHVGDLCSGSHPCEGHEHLPCCSYQAAPSPDSLLQPCTMAANHVRAPDTLFCSLPTRL